MKRIPSLALLVAGTLVLLLPRPSAADCEQLPTRARCDCNGPFPVSVARLEATAILLVVAESVGFAPPVPPARASEGPWLSTELRGRVLAAWSTGDTLAAGGKDRPLDEIGRPRYRPAYAEPTVRIRTGSGGRACGFTFEVGETYLVYAGGKPTLTTSRCSRTRRATEATEDFAVLGAAGVDRRPQGWSPPKR